MSGCAGKPRGTNIDALEIEGSSEKRKVQVIVLKWHSMRVPNFFISLSLLSNVAITRGAIASSCAWVFGFIVAYSFNRFLHFRRS